MRPIRMIASALLLIGTSFFAARSNGGRTEQAAANAGAAPAQAPAASFPKDVYAGTGNRLAMIKRDDLDDAGKKLFDARGANADGFGPATLRLHSVPVADYMGAVNSYLRYKSGLDPRLVQLAILVTARESDSEYEWTAHEPQGVQAGLQPQVIDVVRYREPVTGLAEKDAALIELGREVLRTHHVSPATFARAQGLFGDKEMVEYVSLMGDYAATAILLNAFDQHIRPTDKPLLPIP